jgi:hypothetical protein
MKTPDKVTACVLAFAGLTAFIAAIVADARHRLVPAALCVVLALMMWPWDENSEIN